MRLPPYVDRFYGKTSKLVEKIANLSTRREIAKSGFFDADWYLLSHPYLVHDGVDPLTHFIKNGRRYSLSPSRKFDTTRYLAQHADAASSGINPLLHYRRQGKRHGLRAAPPSAADRIRSSGLFDDRWYLDTYPEARRSGQPPLLHYLVQGYREGKSPGPDFDAAWYSLGYPDIRGSDPLLHYIDHGRDEGRLPIRPLRIQQLAKEIVDSVEDLEPEFYSADYFENTDHIPIFSGPSRNPLSRSFKEIVKAVLAPPHAIVFIPSLLDDEVGLAASRATEAFAQKYGSKFVMVVTTDDDRLEAQYLIPAGVTVVSIVRSDGRLSDDSRKDLVDIIVRGFQPDVVLNVNSRACWQAYKYFSRRLSHFSRLYAMLSCPSYLEDGRRIASFDLYLQHCLSNLTGIYFDNQAYMDDLSSQLCVSSELQTRFVLL